MRVVDAEFVAQLIHDLIDIIEFADATIDAVPELAQTKPLVSFAVTVPLRSSRPPLSVSPVKLEAPGVKSCNSTSTGMLVPARVPPKVTWNPVLFSVPVPPNGATVAVPPAGRSGVSAAAMSVVV